MSSGSLIYIILAGIIALLLALFQYVYKSKKRTLTYSFLAFLRFVTIFSVLLLLINPKFDKITYYNEKPTLVVAIDDSESVAYLDQDDKVKQLIEALKVNDTLNQNFNLEFYAFGKDLKSSDSLSFKDKQSNMALVFERLSGVFNNTVSPTLLITDGNQTYGNDYEYMAKRYKQPVFPIILGDTTKYTDLKIQQLNVNRYAYLKNKFPVEIIATYNGNSRITTQLKISSGTAVLYSQNLSFSKTKTSQVVSLTLPANNAGVRSYKAELIPLANEKNTVNNIKNFAVEVIDQKTNVAIVSEILHPDLGALKKAIESNEHRKATILNVSDYITQSDNFQLAIVYQPNDDFRLVYDEIERLGLNKFVIVGSNTNWSLLNNIQSNYRQQVTNQTEDFQPTLNQNYGIFIIDDLNFDEFPPLQSEFGEVLFSVPVDPILYKTINGTQIEEPLLATFEVDERKEAILIGEGIWRWRAQSYIDEKTFNTFDNFFGKLIQYLSTNKKRSRLNVNYESFYNGNDNVKIDAQFFNKNYEFDSNVTLNIILKNKGTNTSQTLPFVLKNTNYQVDLSGLAAGDYSFTVSAVNEKISKSGELKILEYNVEQQFLNANVTKLRQLATNSNGESYFIEHIDSLVQDLVKDVRFATIQKSSKNIVPLIDWKYLLALIVLSLSAEWFIRKYKGLI